MRRIALLVLTLVGLPASADLLQLLQAERAVLQLRERQIDGILAVAIPYFQKRVSSRMTGDEKAEIRTEVLHLLTSAESKWNASAQRETDDQVWFTLEVLAQEIGRQGARRRAVGELMLSDLEILPTTVATDPASRQARLTWARRPNLLKNLEAALGQTSEAHAFRMIFDRYLPSSVSSADSLCHERDPRISCTPMQVVEARAKEGRALSTEEAETLLLDLVGELNRRSLAALKMVVSAVDQPGHPRLIPDPRQTREFMGAAEASLSVLGRVAPELGSEEVFRLAQVTLDLFASVTHLQQQVSSGRVELGLVRTVASVLGVQILEDTRLARVSHFPKRFASVSGFKSVLLTLVALAPVRRDRPAVTVLEAAHRALETVETFSSGTAVSEDTWKAQVLSLSEALVLADRGRFFLLEPGYSRSLDLFRFEGSIREYFPRALNQALVADDPSGLLTEVSQSLENQEALFPLLAGALSAPAWSRINLIQEIVGGRYKDHSLKVDEGRLPDIERWTVATAPLIRSLARDHQQVFLDPEPVREGLSKVLKSADSARRAALGLKTALANPVEANEKQSIRLALRDYVGSFRHLSNTLDRERREYEVTQLAGLRMNQDLHGQTVAGEPELVLSKTIPSCEGFTFPSAEGKPGVRLPPLDSEVFGKKALSAVPRPIRTALLLKRGKLDACYREVQWVGTSHDEKYDAERGTVVDTLSSRPKLTLVLRYLNEKNVPTDLTRYSVEGKSSVAHRDEPRKTVWYEADQYWRLYGSYYPYEGKELQKLVNRIKAEKQYVGLDVRCDSAQLKTYTDEKKYTRYHMMCWVSAASHSLENFKGAFTEPPPGFESYMEKALSQADLETLLSDAKNTVDPVTYQPLLQEVSQDLENLRRQTVTAFDTKVRENFLKGPSRLHSAAMAIAGSKALLAALLEIAMPDTMARDESVRDQMLKGVGLPDETTLVTFLHSPGTTLDPERSSFYQQIEARAESLHQRLKKVALESGAELADSAETQYERLVCLKRALDLFIPDRTLEDALQGLRRELSGLPLGSPGA